MTEKKKKDAEVNAEITLEQAEEVVSMHKGFKDLAYFNAIMALVETLVKFLNDKKKTGGSGIGLDDFKKFMRTIIVISTLNYRDETVAVEGFNYPLTDYKVHNLFSCLALPRGVYVEIGVEYANLRHGVVVDGYDIYTPAEFKEFQERVLVMFKINDLSWSSDMAILSQPRTLTDALGVLGTFDANSVEKLTVAKAHYDDVNDIHTLPIQLDVDVVVDDIYYNVPWKVWVDNFAHNFVAKFIAG